MTYNRYSPCQPCCEDPTVGDCCYFPLCFQLLGRDLIITDDSGTHFLTYDVSGDFYYNDDYKLECGFRDNPGFPLSYKYDYDLTLNETETVRGTQASNHKRIEFEFEDQTVYLYLETNPTGVCECVGCPGPCGTVWPEVLFITDMHGTHDLAWNGGTGWIGCYMVEQTASDLVCDIGVGPVMIRYGLGCPTTPNPATGLCDRAGLFMDYEIKDCNFALGAYYLSRYKICGDSVNRTWIAQSNVGTYSASPVYAEWTFPATRLEFGSPPNEVFSPLPVHGTIILSQ